MGRDFEYNVRTVIGLLIIAGGVAFSLWLAWWLIFQGDIIALIHDAKMALPGWVWQSLKFGLSGIVGLVVLSFFIVLAVAVFSGGRKQR